MRLSEFIVENMERVLQAWEDFARSIEPGRLMSVAELRDDAERMLRFVAEDIETPQSIPQQKQKSLGLGVQLPEGEQSAAHDHGIARAVAHFSLAELVSEYRALRASVTRLWLDAAPPTHDNVLQLVRFNEAVDQLIAESVVRFAEKLDKDANLFTASVGHDLRTPLNAVIMWAQVLKRSERLDASDRATLARIHEAGARLVVLVRDLQDFTRTRLGSPLAYDFGATDVGAICREAVDELSAAYPASQVVLHRDGDLTAEVDSSRIAQVLSNLVGNAIQHGDPGSPVTVDAIGEPRHIRITVRNAGTPIADVEAIFEPLKRGDSERSKEPGHLGLGLYICRRIAEAHGGSVTATSSATQGTAFVLRLPRKAPESDGTTG